MKKIIRFAFLLAILTGCGRTPLPLSISPADAAIEVGETIQLQMTAGGGPVDVAHSFAMSRDGLATIGANGTLTALRTTDVLPDGEDLVVTLRTDGVTDVPGAVSHIRIRPQENLFPELKKELQLFLGCQKEEVIAAFGEDYVEAQSTSFNVLRYATYRPDISRLIFLFDKTDGRLIAFEFHLDATRQLTRVLQYFQERYICSVPESESTDISRLTGVWRSLTGDAIIIAGLEESLTIFFIDKSIENNIYG